MKGISAFPLRTFSYMVWVLLPFVIAIQLKSPPKEKIPEGYSSQIIAFEFVTDTIELKEVLTPLTSQELANVDAINYIDFGFMLAYNSFLFFIGYYLFQEQKSFVSLSLIVLPFLILAMDVFENIQLLKLSELYRVSNLEYTLPIIAYLKIFTWTKWLSLAVYFCFISLIFKDRIRSMWRYGQLILVIPALLGIFSLMMKQNNLEDAFATSTFLCFILLAALAYFYTPLKNGTTNH